MKTINEYLDELKEKSGSDYATAKALEIRKESLSNMRKRRQISDETAVKIADLLGIDRGELLLAAAMARSEGPVRSAWESISKRAGIAASIMVVALATSCFPGESYAAPAVNKIHYAKYCSL
ncbi:hypothetical protein [Methylomonas koyamae]|uniref:HTH cro/C1-type domain-containing protein n=1 Tax=Methylomonas koyamae TaxID=702114 RepID=A0AA91DA43_9GAMM|nr:hypothetical protein [Methylomonas koyamae]OAI22732.1 hypothetical protein A1356_18995 [Methylomonas koyamae]